MKAIVNEFDDAYKKVDYLEVLAKETEAQVVYDDFFADDLETVEEAVRGVAGLQQATSMIISLAVYHIIEKGLYLDKAQTPTEYFAKAEGNLNISKQLVSKYYKSATAFYRHRLTLTSSGFKATKDFGKLYILERAIETHGPEIVSKLPKLSFREFYDLAMNVQRLDYTSPSVQSVPIEVGEEGFFLEGKLILDVRDVKRIIAEGSEPFLVGVYGRGEKTAITRFITEFRGSR